MKIKRSMLRKIISEEIRRCLVEQSSEPPEKRILKDRAKTKGDLADLEDQSADASEERAKDSKKKAAEYRAQAANHIATASKITVAESDSIDLDEIIEKLAGGKHRLYSKKKNPKTGKRRNLGTFDSEEDAEDHERHVRRFSEWKK